MKLIFSVDGGLPETIESETLCGAIGKMLTLGEEVNPEGCDFNLGDLLDTLGRFANMVEVSDKQTAAKYTMASYEVITIGWGFDNFDLIEVELEGE